MADFASPPPPVTIAEFLAVHGAQLQQYGVPEALWPRLHEKLSGDVFDAGAAFAFAEVEGEARYSVVVNRDGGVAARSDIWLVDHAWTFQSFSDARLQLSSLDRLLERVAEMFGYDLEDLDGEDAAADGTNKNVEAVMRLLPAFASKIALVVAGDEHADDRNALFYVMDELGCSFREAADPAEATFGFAPFFWADRGLSFTIVWPIKDVGMGEDATREPIRHDQQYWEEFYKVSNAQSFDWLCTFEDVRGAFEATVAKDGRVHVVGCGNSTTSADVADARSD